MCLETARVQSFLRSFSFHCRKEERINLGGKLQCRMKSACRLDAWKFSYQMVFVPPWLKKTSQERTKIHHDLCWKVHDRAKYFVLRLCMSHVTVTFLLVCSLVRSKQLLCFVHGQGQNSERNFKNIQQRTL